MANKFYFSTGKGKRSWGFETDTKEEMYDVANSSVGCIAPRHDSSTYFYSTFYGGEESFSTKDNSSESLQSITSSRIGVATKVSSKEPATNSSHNESGKCAAENGGLHLPFFQTVVY